MTTKIEVVNGMVLLDNGDDVMQTRATQIQDIKIFPPGGNYRWRTQISGKCGYIVFGSDTREAALDIQRRVNEVLSVCEVE